MWEWCLLHQATNALLYTAIKFKLEWHIWKETKNSPVSYDDIMKISKADRKLEFSKSVFFFFVGFSIFKFSSTYQRIRLWNTMNIQVVTLFHLKIVFQSVHLIQEMNVKMLQKCDICKKLYILERQNNRLQWIWSSERDNYLQ